MSILQQVARRLERLEALDKVAKPLAGAVGHAVRPRVVRNLLSGTTWASAAPGADRPADRGVGDVGPAGRRRRPGRRGAADLLVTAGVVTAVPTAAAGLNDWSDTAGPETRVGLVHDAVNTTALSLYLASVVAGARDDDAAARRWAWPGWGCCWVVPTWEGTCASSWAWMSTAPRGSSGRTSGRRCWPTPNWPTGNTVRPTRAAYRSCCTGQTERCMPRPAPALTWAARCRRTQSATAASPAHGPAAPSGSPTAASCAARPPRQSPWPLPVIGYRDRRA